jgi:uncharacterized protein (TIGR02453 family)
MGLKPRTTPAAGLFTDETLQFLADLTANNERDWFAANQERYQRFVLAPALELIRRLAPPISQRVSRYFAPSDKRVGGSLMRIHRDVRFARDKQPYKTNIGIHIRHTGGKDVHGPGLYIHIDLDECFLGVGSWRPEPASLAQIRQRILDAPKEWKAARDDRSFRSYFELAGESLKRMPRGFDEHHPFADDLRRKDHTAMAALSLDEVLGDDLVGFCASRFAAAAPYARFLTRAVGAPF